MEFRKTGRRTEQGREFIFATTAGKRHWAILRWTEGTFLVNGYIGIGSPDGLDDVRPVRIKNRRIDADNVEDIAVAGFLAGARLVVDLGIGNASDARQGQLDGWRDFLAQRGEAAGEGRVRLSDDDGVIALPEDDVRRMLHAGLLVKSGVRATTSRQVGVASASAISGLRAAQIQSAVAKSMPCVPSPPRFNIGVAKEALKAVHNPSSRAVMWYGTADTEKSRYRLQAAKAYPTLAGLIADSRSISADVDAMKPIQEGLAERTGFGKGALKRIAKIGCPPPAPDNPFDAVDEGEDALGINRQRRFTVSGSTSLDATIGHLAALSPDRVPQDDQSWRIFNDVLMGCAIPLSNAFGVSVEEILAPSKGDWVSFHATLAKAADMDVEQFDRRRITLSTLDAIQAVEELALTAIMPLILDAISGEEQEMPVLSPEYLAEGMVVGSKVLFGKSKNIAASALEGARRYAGRIRALMGVTASEEQIAKARGERFAQYGPENFPHLVRAEYTASNGLVIRPMNNHPMMIEETERLGHCVGQLYLDQAMKGAPIFSVQNASGDASLSTFQLRAPRSRDVDEVLNGLSLVQHQGSTRNGRQVPAEAQAAYEEFLADLEGGRVQLDLDELEDWSDHLRESGRLGKNRSPQVSWESALGMDWQNAEKREAAWEEWRYILGGRFGKAEHPGILWTEKACRDLLSSMSAETAMILAEKARQARTDAQEEPQMVP